MHNENSNEESFIIISDSKNIKKKAKENLINTKIKESINKTNFQSMYLKIYQLFLQKKKNFLKWMQRIKNEIH